MTEEIKELLNKLEIVAKKHTIEVLETGNIETMPASVVDELRLNNYSAKILLNYITNLQKENEGLKYQIKGYEQERENVLDNIIRENEKLKEDIEDISVSHFSCFKRYDDYKSRSKKAIEYIKNNLTISSILDGKTSYCLNDYSFDYKELLNILQGGDE